MGLDAGTDGDVRRCRTEQTEGREPMEWSDVDWTATEAAVRRLQDRIFRAAKPVTARR